MTRSDLIQLLRRNREELHRNFGVRSLALFGSTARQDARDTSDVDLLVEFDRPVGLLHLIGTQQRLEALLGVPKVDLVLRHAVIPDLRDNILSEAVDVFGPQEVEVSPAAHAAGNR
jgi:predicted nucleotidyltransferase